MNREQAKETIERLFSAAAASGFSSQDEETVRWTIQELDKGKLRVASKESGQWIVHDWVKKAILLYFRMQKVQLIQNQEFTFVDKIPLKKWTGQEGVRVVPQALARYGSFIESGAIMMPSYVNIGAYVGSGTMVDTWATVGSCAQIGANVHLSGGVGIGGVLEPVQAQPVIIEDNCFIGSRCIVVEGALIETGAVLAAGVTLTGSTKIVDVTGATAKISKGRVPPNAVIIPGTLPKQFPAGEYQVNCALLIGYRKESTDKKTSLNDTLREFELSV